MYGRVTVCRVTPECMILEAKTARPRVSVVSIV